MRVCCMNIVPTRTSYTSQGTNVRATILKYYSLVYYTVVLHAHRQGMPLFFIWRHSKKRLVRAWLYVPPGCMTWEEDSHAGRPSSEEFVPSRGFDTRGGRERGY